MLVDRRIEVGAGSGNQLYVYEYYTVCIVITFHLYISYKNFFNIFFSITKSGTVGSYI